MILREYAGAGGNPVLRGMFNNEVDIAAVSDGVIMHNSFQRDDFLLFATVAAANNEVKIIARKDRGIKNTADLRGKKISTRKGMGQHFFPSLFLKQQYIPESEVNIVYMEPGNLIPAIISGEIDAFSCRGSDSIFKHAKELLGDNAVVFSAPSFR